MYTQIIISLFLSHLRPRDSPSFLNLHCVFYQKKDILLHNHCSRFKFPQLSQLFLFPFWWSVPRSSTCYIYLSCHYSPIWTNSLLFPSFHALSSLKTTDFTFCRITLLNLGLFDISIGTELGHAFLAGMLQKGSYAWLCVPSEVAFYRPMPPRWRWPPSPNVAVSQVPPL